MGRNTSMQEPLGLLVGMIAERFGIADVSLQLIICALGAPHWVLASTYKMNDTRLIHRRLDGLQWDCFSIFNRHITLRFQIPS